MVQVAPRVGECLDQQQAVAVLALGTARQRRDAVGAVVGHGDEQAARIDRRHHHDRAAGQPRPAVQHRVGGELGGEQQGSVGARMVIADSASHESPGVADVLRQAGQRDAAQDQPGGQ